MDQGMERLKISSAAFKVSILSKVVNLIRVILNNSYREKINSQSLNSFIENIVTMWQVSWKEIEIMIIYENGVN